MIVITSPDIITNETAIIHRLFEEGMNLLHIRKPKMLKSELTKFINNIDKAYHPKLVMHQYYELAEDFDIRRFHITEKNRVGFYECTKKLKDKPNVVFSTSTHTIEEFNGLPTVFQYAFLSPVYESISKQGYKSGHDILASVQQRANFTSRLVALGGITHTNCINTITCGFDDIAVLGAIWNAKHPLEEFKKCLWAITNYVQ